MWFESQTLTWKIRRRTKAPDGGYHTRLRLWCAGACCCIPWAQGRRTLEAFHRLRRLLAPAPHHGLEESLPSSPGAEGIVGSGSSVGLGSTATVKKQPPSSVVLRPSISHRRLRLWCEEFFRKYWFDYQPAAVPVCVPKSCLQSAAQLRSIFIFIKVRRCHWRGRNDQ